MFSNKILVATVCTILINGITAEVLSGNEKAIARYNLIRENQEFGTVRYERYCSSTGIMCKNCTTTVLCIEIDDGIFEQHAADNCRNGQNCFEIKCVEPMVNPHCSKMMDIPFVCSSIGMFPDQLDCRKFHICVSPTINVFKNYDAECTPGYKYNSKSTYCDKKLVGNKCYDNMSEFPIPQCLKNGAMGAVYENPSIFYICEYYKEQGGTTTVGTTTVDTTTEFTTPQPEEPFLYPYLYLCAHGKIYDPELMKCL